MLLPHDDRGAGEAVVLLHAGIADRSMWHEHLDWLAGEGFRAIAVDLPGFGEAAVAAGPQAPWEDVLETLKELDVRRAALVGDSFGAAVALRVAVLAPAAVSALVLVSPPPVVLDQPSPALSAVWAAEEDALERGDIEAAVAAILDGWLAPDAPTALRERVAAMQRRAFELQLAVPDPQEAPDPLEQAPDAVRDLQIPVLTVAGDGDMPEFRTAATEIAESVPDGRSAVVQGAGHLAPLEAPAEFQRLLLEFLRSAPAPASERRD
jgi:pimeloyl-ACP methyl ester carboxylesterase